MQFQQGGRANLSAGGAVRAAGGGFRLLHEAPGSDFDYLNQTLYLEVGLKHWTD